MTEPRADRPFMPGYGVLPAAEGSGLLAWAEAERRLTVSHDYWCATVRPDGGPRLHPMCPVIDGDELYAFLVPSPKRRDLHRDGRYAMHSFPADDNEDAFSITGSAAEVPDRRVRDEVAARFLAERTWSDPPPGFDEQELFAFDIETCLLTTTTGHGDPHPTHTVWHAHA